MNEQTKMLIQILDKYQRILTNPDLDDDDFSEEKIAEFIEPKFEEIKLDDTKMILGELCMVLKYIIEEQAKKEGVVDKFFGKIDKDTDCKNNYYT